MTHPDRQLFATLADARAVADLVRAAPGWRVLLVRGDAPGGPARTSIQHTRVMLGDAHFAARRVRRTPPAIVAATPDGRRVTIGSRERWEALQ
jgi:hypothetical protein